MTRYEMILKAIEELDEGELIYLHNNYCDSVNAFDDCIYSMDDFEEITNGINKYELLRMAFNGDFNPNDDYFYFNGYGNLASANWVGNLCIISLEEIAEWIDTNEDALYIDSIEEILEETFEEV